jgi:hypothetical protein
MMFSANHYLTNINKKGAYQILNPIGLATLDY